MLRCYDRHTCSVLTFEDYLSYDDGTDNRYELIDGALVPLPSEIEVGQFWGSDSLLSPTFPALTLRAEQVLQVESVR